MAKIFCLQNSIVRFIKTKEEETRYGVPPEFDEVIEFDPETNTDAINGLDTDWNSHRVEGGQLLRSGVPVTINPPGEEWKAEENATDVKSRFLLSQLANKTPVEIYTLMQARMDAWSNLGQAKADLREWLPLLSAIIAWKVI